MSRLGSLDVRIEQFVGPLSCLLLFTRFNFIVRSLHQAILWSLPLRLGFISKLLLLIYWNRLISLVDVLGKGGTRRQNSCFISKK